MSARSSLAPMRAAPPGSGSAGPGRDEDVLTVAQLDAMLQRAVRGLGALTVEGEITGFRGAQSGGHLYFSLKDERGAAVIRCVMWKSDAQRGQGRERIVNGARVQVRATLDLYAPQGNVQLQVTRVTPAGLGDLLLRREELKRKLAAEGLFEPSRKRKLPATPRVVGVVTSATGAAFADIVKVARRRGAVRILLDAAPVQGEDAPRLLRRALSRLAAVREVDVIIVGRGGGSAEDLAAFDDEALARAIADCPKPVVAAVGHEVDWSIACLVADVRAATPSQAAELVVADEAARRAQLLEAERRLVSAVRARLQAGNARVARARALLRAPERTIALHQQRLDELRGRVEAAMRKRLRDGERTHASLAQRLQARHPRVRLEAARAELGPLEARLRSSMRALLQRNSHALANSVAKLEAISPLAVLARGYAIALRSTPAGPRALRAASEVSPGDVIDVRLHDGTVRAEVTGRGPGDRE